MVTSGVYVAFSTASSFLSLIPCGTGFVSPTMISRSPSIRAVFTLKVPRGRSVCGSIKSTSLPANRDWNPYVWPCMYLRRIRVGERNSLTAK